MSGFDISKYRSMFLEESVELFENTDSILLRAEENGELDDDDMNSLFRYVHTLKGSSASVELSNFAKFTHEVESFMDKLRNKQLQYEPEMATLLIDCVDTMKTLLDDEVNGVLTPATFDEMTREYINAIKEISEGTPVSQKSSVQVSKTMDAPVVKTVLNVDEDAFGFFDDEFLPKAEEPLISEDEAFGFFDEEYCEQAPKNTITLGDDEGFGFFDDDEPAEVKVFGLMQGGADEGFGFFDDDIVAPKTSIPKVEQNTPPAPQKQQVSGEHFGFFEQQYQLKQAQMESLASLAETKVLPDILSEKVEPQPKAESEKQVIKASDKEQGEVNKDVKATNSIRVDLSKIDVLMNNVGELVIVNSMLFQLTEEISDAATRGKVTEKLKLLDRYIRELQDSVMAVRMVPMENIYSKFPKTIRDISKKLGKKVEFKHIGDNVEIDKAMIEGLTDPLMHIVRNSLDHGLENPEIRRSRGKPESGTIMISAEQANGQILISISDDGGGIPADRVAGKAVERGVISKSQFDQMTHDEKVMMIFAPGLSTAEQVTDLSGRGVGMDVVKTNITKLGGSISVVTELGVGTTMTIALPLTLAILDGLNIRIAEKHYILPLASIVESLQPKVEMIKRIGDGDEELLMLRSEFIPVVRLHKLFSIEPEYMDLTKGMLIVVRAGTQKLALFVDEFLHQQQVVVKPIDKNFTNVRGIGGATVRGDGSIGLIIDVIGILEEQKKLERRRLK